MEGNTPTNSHTWQNQGNCRCPPTQIDTNKLKPTTSSINTLRSINWYHSATWYPNPIRIVNINQISCENTQGAYPYQPQTNVLSIIITTKRLLVHPDTHSNSTVCCAQTFGNAIRTNTYLWCPICQKHFFKERLYNLHTTMAQQKPVTQTHHKLHVFIGGNLDWSTSLAVTSYKAGEFRYRKPYMHSLKMPRT